MKYRLLKYPSFVYLVLTIPISAAGPVVSAIPTPTVQPALAPLLKLTRRRKKKAVAVAVAAEDDSDRTSNMAA